MIAILCGFLTAWASQSVAQSLLNATARYSQLSDFNDLLLNFPDAAASLLANFSSNNNRQTVLVPSNDAFDNYRERTGASISSLSSSDVGNVLSYHTLQGALSSSDLQQPRGLISNTALVNETYDDREVLLNRQAKLSQVVFISSSNSSDGKTKIKARQIGGLFSADVRSGEGNDVNLEPTPGNWSGGVFYVVDGFLTLPVNQTNTMTARGLNSMVRGLNRTNVTEGTNAAKGLTCVCPTDEAFAAFGDLTNTNANLTDGLGSLLATLTRHGLTGSYYSTNFSDGDLIQSQNGYPILVTRRNGSIFLNDARVVGSNFIARTGAVHALDRVMGYLNTTTNVTTPANASIYSDASNIPSPTPVTTAAASSTVVSGGAIPTSDTIGSQALPSVTPESGSPTDTATGAAATSTGDSDVSSHSHIAFAGWPMLMAIGMILL